MTRAALAALLLLAACDQAPSTVSDAPGRYDRTGEVLLIVHSAEDTQRVCRRLGNPNADACFTITVSGVCTIYLPDPRDHGARATGALLDHELAHCNGWPPHHPG